jgi:WD40 repeat protein
VTELSEAGFWSADFSADGSRVVTAAHDGYAQVWDAKTGKPTGPRFTHTGQVVSAVFDGDGRRVVTASTDGTAKVWAVTTETTANAVPLFILKHADSVTSARFTPDGRQVVTTSSDWTARAWTLATAPASVIVMPHEAPVDIAELDPRGTRLLTVSTRAGTIRLWDVSTGRALTQVDVPRTLVLSARFSPDGQRIVSAWDDGYARLFDVPTGDAADSEWLAALAEAVSARRTDELGAVIVLTDQGKRLEGFRNEARQTGDKTGTFRQRWLRKLLLGGAAGI